jgi:hypothetical protein
MDHEISIDHIKTEMSDSSLYEMDHEISIDHIKTEMSDSSLYEMNHEICIFSLVRLQTKKFVTYHLLHSR